MCSSHSLSKSIPTKTTELTQLPNVQVCLMIEACLLNLETNNHTVVKALNAIWMGKRSYIPTKKFHFLTTFCS